MAKAMDVANYLIHLRNTDEGNGQYFFLSNLKLQKLLYYCQGGQYRWHKQQLINDRLFEAWDYGPTIDKVYESFKKFAQADVYTNNQTYKLSVNEQETINSVWRQLKGLHTFDLVGSTRAETPWLNARKHNQVFINNDHIKTFFTLNT